MHMGLGLRLAQLLKVAVPSTLLALALAGPALAGRLIATGHDADLHCGEQGAQCHYYEVAVNYVRAGAPNPSLPVLVLDRLNLDAEVALDTAFGAGVVPRVVMDPRSAAFATAPITTSLYSALIVASDITCGGCDLNEFGSTPDSDAINARATDIAAFFNAGGGILALAGADHGNGTDPDDVYYNFVPLPIGGVSVSAPFTLTPKGIALGFQDSDNGIGTNDDINCCATHNSFTNPPANSAIMIAEFDTAGFAETLFAQGIIGPGGIIPLGGVQAPAMSWRSMFTLAALLFATSFVLINRRRGRR